MFGMEQKICCGAILGLLLVYGAQSSPSENGNKIRSPRNYGQVSSEHESTVLFYLYTKENIDSPLHIRNGDVKALKSLFRAHRKTSVVIHGYHNNVSSPATQDVKDALLTYDDVNVIAIDWSYYTRNFNYGWVVSELEGVGSYIADFVEFVIQQMDISPDQVHLIGHSIGAHASGFVGKKLKAKGLTVARISGLDPAYPGFYITGPSGRLASTDAKFVDCIHTCGGQLGFPFAICDADFFPNGGINVQPGCSWLDLAGICSHGRSFDYYAESINPNHLFVAEKCATIVGGVPYQCSKQGALMGYPASDKHLGNFYLRTRSRSPYALNITSDE